MSTALRACYENVGTSFTFVGQVRTDAYGSVGFILLRIRGFHFVTDPWVLFCYEIGAIKLLRVSYTERRHFQNISYAKMQKCEKSGHGIVDNYLSTDPYGTVRCVRKKVATDSWTTICLRIRMEPYGVQYSTAAMKSIWNKTYDK